MEEQDEDAVVVRRVLSGERAAYAALVERHQKAVYNVALRLVQDRDEAEEAAQAAFVKAYENLKSFDFNHRFFSWLYRIAVNEALNSLRRRKHLDPLDEEISAGEPAGTEDMAEKVQESLMRLPVDYRTVIVLRHFQDLSYDEIAQVLDISVKKVKSRLFSARASLRVILDQMGLREYAG
jgi:RNA polymerase sigma-70 factor (ECF subfamily)